MSEEAPYEINESASGHQFVWVDGPGVHILVHGRGEAGEARDALNIAYNQGRRPSPDAVAVAKERVIERARTLWNAAMIVCAAPRKWRELEQPMAGLEYALDELSAALAAAKDGR